MKTFGDDFYLLQVERRKELALIPLDILRGYARRNGLPLEAPRLFAGRTVFMKEE